MLERYYKNKFCFQRPIVEFSLENRSALKAREKRMEKSKEKNPLWKKEKKEATKKGKLAQTALYVLNIQCMYSVPLQEMIFKVW